MRSVGGAFSTFSEGWRFESKTGSVAARSVRVSRVRAELLAEGASVSMTNLHVCDGRGRRSRTIAKRFGFVADGVVCALLAALVAPTSGLAQQQSAPADSDAWPQSWAPPSPSTSGAPRWSFSAETIVLGRAGGANQPLVSLVSGSQTFSAAQGAAGAEAFNSDQFRPALSVGPKVTLIYRDDGGFGAELSYFNIFNQSATKSVGPNGDWLIMKAPGIFTQTQDFADQAMVWRDATNLHGAEANGRLDLSSRVTVLAGFRWLQLNDSLAGSLTPVDRATTGWKIGCSQGPDANTSKCTLPGIPANPTSGPVVNSGPFWTTSTTNNLLGGQIGADVKLLERGRLSLEGIVKAGVFNNYAEQSTGVSMEKKMFPTHAAANRAAFVGEADLQLKYRLTEGLALKLGYEALWFDGVALAPGQIQETYSSLLPNNQPTARALGVNTGSSALFQGASAGFEFSF